MTEQNKPIIIDGVDVTECRLSDDETHTMCNAFRCGCDNSGFYQPYCIQNPNCYYKQLQRMKTERNNFKKEYRKERVKRIKLEETLREIKIHAHIGFSICNECEEKIKMGGCNIECGAHKLLSRINGMIK